MYRLSQVQTTILSVLLLMPLGAYADNGFFVGGSIGSAELSDDFDGLNIDTDATSFRIVGGWRFNDYFSVEGGYHDLETSSNRSMSTVHRRRQALARTASPSASADICRWESDFPCWADSVCSSGMATPRSIMSARQLPRIAIRISVQVSATR